MAQKSKALKKFQRHASNVFRANTRSVYHSLTLSLRLQEKAKGVFQGRIDIQCPTTAKVVRIFTSSTFTDTQNERNMLMERVYPRLKEYCQGQGYQFQVVDMRWGVRDEATDDHMGTELCLREIEMCQKLSTGPNFVTFLSHKYGYQAFPRVIETTEFESILSHVTSSDDKELINRWFLKDDNSVPSSYVLQPISSVFPDFLMRDKEKCDAAKNAWYQESERFQSAIVKAAGQALSAEQLQKYQISVTEAEIRQGLLNYSSRSHSTSWFKRNITDIDSQPASKKLSLFTECLGDKEDLKQTKDLLADLEYNRMTKLLPTENIYEYNIPWAKDKGIDPDLEDHKEYLDELCTDFERCVISQFDAAVLARNQTELNDPLYEEIVQHTLFCQTKCETFHGRDATLKKIKQYMKNDSNLPFVVHGESGCGKTSITAMVAKLSWGWFDGKATIILRFLGTTPDSSNIAALLTSVIKQIYKAHGKHHTAIPDDLKALKEKFAKVLELASTEKPLVLVLDSLDQLDTAGAARQLQWLPEELPSNVKVVLSTLPGRQYECFPKLQSRIKDSSQFLEVPVLADRDVGIILDSWLSLRGRSLSTRQKQMVVKVFRECSLPLFLKLSFEEACRWKSYSLPDATVLQTTVRDSINALFSRVETMHGKVLVSRTLGYLTTALNGLADSELQDILSCDDDVLDEVYHYWTPPMRRLPPLILLRIKADLDQYLVDRGADGVRLFNWYHRQFIEAANARYCRDENTFQILHRNLADYFSGTWVKGNLKPYVNADGKTVSADRQAASQPLRFGSAYNQRKLNNLPYHLTTVKALEELKTQTLCNFEFLLAKLSANNLRSVLDDLSRARLQFPKDPDLRALTEALWLSKESLGYDPNQLASQLLGRIKPTETTRPLLDQCRMSSVPFLLPNKSILIQPGGQLVHSFSGHSYTIQDMCLTADGMHAVTISSDFTAKIWDVGEGVLIRTIDLGEEDDSSEPTLVKLADDDALIIISIGSDIKSFKFDTGELVYCIHEKTSDNYPTNTKFAVCGFGKLLAVIYDSKLCIFDALDGALVKTLEDNIIKEQPIIEESDEEDEEETSASPNNEEGNNTVNETPPESPPTSPDAEMSEMAPTSPDAEMSEMPPTSPDAEMSEMAPFSSVGEISEEPPSYGYGAYIAGCGRYVAAVDNDAVYLQIIDTDKETFVHQKRFFPEPATPQNDDDDDDVDDVISISSVVVKPDDKCVFVFGSDDLLHICDILSLDELKVITVKGGYYVQNLQITQDGHHVFFAASDRIISFDIDDDKSTNLIEGSADICTVASIDMKSMVTGSYEGHIRIWDLTREPTKVKKVIKKKKPEIESDVDTKDDDSGQGEKDDDDGDEETDTRTIGNLCAMENTRYVLYIAYESGARLCVYDIIQKKDVRIAEMNEAPSSLKLLNDTTAIVINSSNKMKLLNLETMTVSSVFKGTVAYPYEYCLLKNKKELLCSTRYQHKLKVYDVTTGATIKIINPLLDTKAEVDSIVTNDIGSVFAVSFSQHNSIYVYHADDCQLFRTITNHVTGSEVLDLTHGALSNDGGYLLTSIERFPKGHKKTEEDDDDDDDVDEPTYMVSIDLNNDNVVHHLVDLDEFEESMAGEASMDVESACIVDDSHVMIASYGSKLCVFDFRTGHLTKTSPGDNQCGMISCVQNGGEIMVYDDDGQVISMFDRKTYERLATYKPDYQNRNLILCNNGRTLVGDASEVPEIVAWSLSQRNSPDHNMSKEPPVLYHGEKLDLKVNVVNSDDEKEDPGDLDTDSEEEIPDGSDSDFDDDDDEEEEEEDDDDDDDGDGVVLDASD